MRVVLLSRAALVATYRPKLEAIARTPGLELTVVVPPRWKEPGRVQEREPGPTPGYDVVVEPIALNGSFHTHWYPRFGRLLRDVRPDVLYVEEEPYTVAAWHATRLAARAGIRVVCVTGQNIDRRHPPPFSIIERATLARVDHLVCGSREALDVWRAKGYRGGASVVPASVDPERWTPRPADAPARQYTDERIAEQTVDACRAATTRRPRVTVVAHEVHDDGGMEAAMAHLLRRAAADWDVTVVTARLDPELQPLARWRRVRIPAAPFALRILAFGLQAAPLIRAERADLVHTVGALVPNRADLATVHYCHAAVPADARTAGDEVGTARRVHSHLCHWLSVTAERWCYRPSRLRRAAAVSPGVAEEFAAAYPGIPVSVTPNGVDLQRFAPDPAVRAAVRAEAGIGPDDVVVLFVGGDWVRKGLAIAITAVGRLAREGVPVHLWVVGRGDVERYRGLTAEAGLAARATFFGFRSDRERYFQAADVFTLPTRYETFCIAAFEAAAAELPIVMTRVNDVGALVRDGSGGALVDRDPDALTDALRPLVTDPKRRAVDGSAARARAETYTWDASAASVLALYHELVGARR